jgi:hypothetical protein
MTGHVTKSVIETSVGGIEADRLIEGLRADLLTPDCAWFRFIELAARQGWRSEGCKSFVMTLANRAAGN